MATCLIALGSNLGNRETNLRESVRRIHDLEATCVTRQSTIHGSAPVGGPVGQQPYLNGVVCIETALPPARLLSELLAIENSLGRVRGLRWSARTIDLDLLLYDSLCLNTPDLVVPHPRLSFRRFVLEPACEIAPEYRHPESGWSLRRHLDNLDRPQTYVALTGPPGVDRNEILTSMADGSIVVVPDPAQASVELSLESTGHHADTAIELLRLRSRAVSDALANAGTAPVVSGFWLNETHALARSGESPAGNTGPEKGCAEEAPQLQPKLLVLLESLDPNTGLLHPACDLLRCEMTRAGGLPALRLTATDPAHAVSEMKAAIQAMA